MKFHLLRFALILIAIIPHALTAQNTNQSGAMGAVFGESVDVPERFNFNHSVKMELSTTDKVAGLSNDIVYTVWYSDTDDYIGMKPEFINGQKPVPNAEMVVDFDGLRTITFLNAETSKMAMVYPVDKTRLGLSSKKPAAKIVKTDRFEKILGYKCREYELITDEIEGKYWLTTELNLNAIRSLQALNLQLETGLQNIGEDERGFILKYQTTKKSNGEQSEMTVLEIKLEDPYALTTGDYMFTSMPEVQGELSE